MIIPRRSRPFPFIATEEQAMIAGVDQLPGVVINSEGVWCGRDSVEIVGGMLGVPSESVRAAVAPYDVIEASDWPGLTRFEQSIAPRLRPYQPEPIAFMASRTAALNCDPCRTGKNVATYGAVTLVDARQTLILTSGTPKLGWAEDAAKWLGASSLILEGRSGTEAWWFCVPCAGRGLYEMERCLDCRGRGWQKVEDINEALTKARVIIANFDILIGQKEADLAGVERLRADLPGWVPKLLKHGRYDTVVLDEAHKIGEKGLRRQSVRHLLHRAKRVWATTATPTDGKLVKLWTLIDLVTGSMWGRSKKKFAARYAEGFQSEWGFSVPKDGRSIFADTELPHRLKHLMIRREKSEIWPHMPPMTRQVIRLQKTRKTGGTIGAPGIDALEHALDQTAAEKIQTVVDAILEELREGNKVTCFTRRRNTGETISEALHKALVSKRESALKFRNTAIWNCIGKTVDSRVNMADRFSEHAGAGAFIATMDGFQTGRSLLGVSTNHFPDLHWDPTTIHQCEERASVHDRPTGLVSVFYIIEGSSDDHLIAVLIPKLEALTNVLGDKRSGDFQADITKKETLDEVWKRHTAHLKACR